MGRREPALAHLVAGVERADSWATDAHKWLNVPYDCGLVFVRAPRRAPRGDEPARGYLVHAEDGGPRDPIDWMPESSRRARGFAVYAALRSLGRSGVAELVERCCRSRGASPRRSARRRASRSSTTSC